MSVGQGTNRSSPSLSDLDGTVRASAPLETRQKRPPRGRDERGAAGIWPAQPGVPHGKDAERLP